MNRYHVLISYGKKTYGKEIMFEFYAAARNAAEAKKISVDALSESYVGNDIRVTSCLMIDRDIENEGNQR